MTGDPHRIPVPALDRAALERVLQRAAELHAADQDVGEGISEDEILALGREVGLPARHLQQAILEERTRSGQWQPEGLLDRSLGPGEVAAQRVVQIPRATVEAILLRWLGDEEFFAVQRQTATRITWEPSSGIMAAMHRAGAGLRSGRIPPMLNRARMITATFTDLEPGYLHVTLAADLRGTRGSYVGGGAAALSATVAGSAVLLALGAFVPLALAPLALGAGLGWGISVQYRPVIERTRLGLERVLDVVERGAVKAEHAVGGPSLMGMLAGEVRRALEQSQASRKRLKGQ